MIVRVILGLLLFSGLAIASSDWVSFWIQIVLSSGVLLLLVGNASRPRIIGGVALLSLYMVAAVAGLQQMATGKSFLTPLYSRGLYDLDPIEPSRLHGSTVAYTIEPPVDGWQLRTPEAVRRDNPVVDHWLVNPAMDAHILVIAESVDPGSELSVEALSDAVISNFEAAIEGFWLDGRIALYHSRPSIGGPRTLLHRRGPFDSLPRGVCRFREHSHPDHLLRRTEGVPIGGKRLRPRNRFALYRSLGIVSVARFPIPKQELWATGSYIR